MNNSDGMQTLTRLGLISASIDWSESVAHVLTLAVRLSIRFGTKWTRP